MAHPPKKFETILTHALGYTKKKREEAIITSIIVLSNPWKHGRWHRIHFILGIRSFYYSLTNDKHIIIKVGRYRYTPRVQYFLGDILLCELTHEGLRHNFIDVSLWQHNYLTSELGLLTTMPTEEYTVLKDDLYHTYGIILA